MPTGGRWTSLDGASVRRLAVVLLTALCVLVAAQAGPWQPTQRVGLPVTVPSTQPPRDTAPEPAVDDRTTPPPSLDAGPDLGWVPRAVVVVLAAVLLALLVRWALRRQLPARPALPDAPAGLPPVPGPGPEGDPDVDVLRDGARAAAEHLRGTAASADAVIAAWVALEDAAARSGAGRAPSATAAEFTLDVLDRTRADPAAARTLLGLYLRARFDDRPLATAEVDAAARSARSLVDTLAAPARDPAR